MVDARHLKAGRLANFVVPRQDRIIGYDVFVRALTMLLRVAFSDAASTILDPIPVPARYAAARMPVASAASAERRDWATTDRLGTQGAGVGRCDQRYPQRRWVKVGWELPARGGSPVPVEIAASVHLSQFNVAPLLTTMKPGAKTRVSIRTNGSNTAHAMLRWACL
jgi:hypothetical protein